VQLQNVEQNSSLNSENNWQKVSRKRQKFGWPGKSKRQRVRLLAWRNNNNHQQIQHTFRRKYGVRSLAKCWIKATTNLHIRCKKYKTSTQLSLQQNAHFYY
jgi:hypothetical protein